ncbi:uncharacterized protein TNCV_587871 [Trichonephila clavipes]|nr:uncharacterized protein TNCV_587871 [Trichonephila clavipes]
MATPGSLFTPTPLSHEDNLEVRHPLRANALQWRPGRFSFPNPKRFGMRVFERSFLGKARDWFDIFGSELVQNTATDFEQLKAALTKNFPVVHNRKDLEIQFYSSQQIWDEKPMDFIYDLLKIHKKPVLSISEEALVYHIFVRLEPQVQAYVEVRNPKTTAQLLKILAKFEETYSCKKMQGSRNSDNVEQRDWLSKINRWFESRNGLKRDDRRFDRGYQSGNRVQSEIFSQGDRRNRGSSTNFSRCNRRQGGRLNVLKVRDEQNDRSQSAKEVPIKLSAICMSPVELPYVPILLDETFTKALWDTGVDKSFISEDIYQKYFFYKQVKKSRTHGTGS